MARTLLTDHAPALAAVKARIVARDFRGALNLISDGGAFLPFRAPHGEPESGGFYLRPSECDGDSDLELFRSWARGEVPGADGRTHDSFGPTYGALQCDFGADGRATRDWCAGGMP